MDALGGYASSDDDDTKQHQQQQQDVDGVADASVTSNAGKAESSAEKAERKRAKKERKERKAAKAAATSAAAPVSLNAPLPTPKLALPSAAGLLAEASARPSTFLALQEADRVREALAAASESGGVLIRSTPKGVHADASLRALEKQAEEEKQNAAREEALSAPERESLRAKRKAIADATKRVAASASEQAYSAAGDRPSKKARDGSSEQSGPARASKETTEKEKLKRGKGQSGIESGWKSEEWMKQRQNYDG